jgi:hypothetical protein
VIYGALRDVISVRRPCLLIGWLILGDAVSATADRLFFKLIVHGLASGTAVAMAIHPAPLYLGDQDLGARCCATSSC